MNRVNPPTRRIPNLFHFVFGLQKQREPFHLAHYLCLASCRAVNNPDKMYFYYHHEPWGYYWDLARTFVTPVRVPLEPFITDFRYADPFVARYRYAHQSDFIRLERLLRVGGVYADIDTIFVNPFPDRLWEMPFVLGREGDVVPEGGAAPQPSLCNALIMAEPHAAFGEIWISEMRRVFDGSWSGHSTLLPERLRRSHPDLLHVEPERSFYRHRWTREGIRTLFEGLDEDFDGIVSLHLWSHLWWARRRRDFSRFHAGLLTEKSIASIDTTYNVIARRHLPPARTPGERLRHRLRESLARPLRQMQ